MGRYADTYVLVQDVKRTEIGGSIKSHLLVDGRLGAAHNDVVLLRVDLTTYHHAYVLVCQDTYVLV